MDAVAQFKERQKQTWAGFTVLENFTGTCAPRLVRFAGIDRGTTVLDVGCGTGVVALTAARAGAKVTGVDLTPELVKHARENASLAGLERSDPAKLAQLRTEWDGLISLYFKDNLVRQDYLLARAVKC